MNRIQDLRKQAKLSQDDLAKIVHVHQTAVSQWETGKTYPDTSTLILLADYFNVSIDYILGRSDNPDTKYHITEKDLPEYERIMLKAYRNSTPELQNLALAALAQHQSYRKENKAKT